MSTMTPIWVYFMGPLASLLAAGATLLIIVRQLSLSRNTLSSNTMLSMEDTFWREHRSFYERIELGEFDSRSLDSLNFEQVAELERYLGFFNLIGVLSKKDALDLRMILDVYPYRLYRALDLPCVAQVLERYPESWQGLKRLKEKHDALPSRTIGEQKKVLTYKKTRRKSPLGGSLAISAPEPETSPAPSQPALEEPPP